MHKQQIVMKLRIFENNNINYNIDEKKLNSTKNFNATNQLTKVKQIKLNMQKKILDYDVKDKKNMHVDSMGGVYGCSINNENMYRVHNNNLSDDPNVKNLKNKIDNVQKNNPAFARFIISQKTWQDFYANYLVANKGSTSINAWQVHADLKSVCEQYHKCIFIKKYNKENNLKGDKRINLQTHNLDIKLHQVGYDQNNFNFYFSQHTNTDNPHFHVVVWDKTIKNNEDYRIYKQELFEVKKNIDKRMYRNTKWKDLHELVTKKNYLEFEKDVTLKNNFDLLNFVFENNITNFRYAYLTPKQKNKLDILFNNYFSQNKEFKKLVNNVSEYYKHEASLGGSTKNYVDKNVDKFLQPYKQIILNEMKEMTYKKNQELLKNNTRTIKINLSKFVQLESTVSKIFSLEFNENNIQVLENYLNENNYKYDMRKQILNYYFYKKGVKDYNLKNKYLYKYNVKNNHSKISFELSKSTKIFIECVTTINEYCNKNNLDLYTQLDLKILYLQQKEKSKFNQEQIKVWTKQKEDFGSQEFLV